MDDLTALYKAVQANPRNGDPRLQLADELEARGQVLNAISHRIIAQPWTYFWREQLARFFDENGDPVRGQFVRDHLALRETKEYDFKCAACGAMPDDNGFVIHGGVCLEDEKMQQSRGVVRVPQSLRWMALKQHTRDAFMENDRRWRLGPQCPTCLKADEHKPGTARRDCLYCGGMIDGGGLLETAGKTPEIDHRHKYAVDYSRPENPGCKTITVPNFAFLYDEVRLPVPTTFKKTHHLPSQLLMRFVRHPDTVQIWCGDKKPHWNGRAYCWYARERKHASGAVPVSAELPNLLLRWLSMTEVISERAASYSTEVQGQIDLAHALVRWATAMY